VKTNILEGKRYFKKIIKHKANCRGYGQMVIFLSGALSNFQKKKKTIPAQ